MVKLSQRRLWQRAHNYVERYQPTMVGIAGSRGKTMVKEALQLALDEKHYVRAAPFSYRSRSDAAKAILGRSSFFAKPQPEQPSIILLELGTKSPGDLDYFARTLPFKISIITNVHSTNLHLYQSKAMVAHEQSSMVAALSHQSIACLNRDDPDVAEMANHTRAKVIWYGQTSDSDVRLVRSQRLPSLGFACELSIRGNPLELHLPHIIADYQISNILAALAGALALEADIKTVASAVSAVRPPAGRMRLLNGVGESKLLDDTYDSTPESMLLALKSLPQFPAHRRIAILGDINNLGAHNISWHEEIGQTAGEVADIVLAIGDNMRHAGAKAIEQAGTDVHHFTDNKTAGNWLKTYLRKDDLVYLAGSRSMKMEQVAVRLLATSKDTKELVKL